MEKNAIMNCHIFMTRILKKYKLKCYVYEIIIYNYKVQRYLICQPSEYWNTTLTLTKLTYYVVYRVILRVT